MISPPAVVATQTLVPTSVPSVPSVRKPNYGVIAVVVFLLIAAAAVVTILLLTGAFKKKVACTTEDRSACATGEGCVNKVCAKCTKNEDCGTGRICTTDAKGAKICIADSLTCTTAATCSGNKGCVAGKCADCIVDTDCVAGSKCSKNANGIGTCSASGTSSTCTTAATCPSGQGCVGGVCVLCVADDNCRTGEWCDLFVGAKVCRATGSYDPSLEGKTVACEGNAFKFQGGKRYQWSPSSYAAAGTPEPVTRDCLLINSIPYAGDVR